MSDLAAPVDPALQAAPVSIMTPGMVRLFALLCCVIIANIYYAQSIIDVIAPDIGLSVQAASLIVSFTQVGFALGVFLIVPLGDILENRSLIVGAVLVSAVGLALEATSRSGGVFLGASVLVGLTTVAVQMIVPLAAQLAPDATRGRVVGGVMSGLTLGILLSRPLASIVTDHFGWRVLFGAASVAMVAAAVTAALKLPRREPKIKVRYGALIWSLIELMRTTPVLRRRSLYQACMFSSFSMFWTAAPLELARNHGLSQTQIGLFALMGAAGVVAGPIGGRLADAGHTRLATRIALCAGALVMLMGATSFGQSVLALCITGVLLDFSVQGNMVLGQRAIYALPPEWRSRLNALYMTSLFIGGALGSAVASALFDHGGWPAIAVAGSVLPLIAAIRSFFDR